jgi:hypothetical protein
MEESSACTCHPDDSGKYRTGGSWARWSGHKARSYLQSYQSKDGDVAQAVLCLPSEYEALRISLAGELGLWFAGFFIPPLCYYPRTLFLSGFYPLLPKNAAIHFFSWFFFVEEER